MNQKYIVRLTHEEREELNKPVTKGKGSADQIRHANILLKADVDGAGWCDEEIAQAFSVHKNTVAGIRQRFVEEGLEAAFSYKKAPSTSFCQRIFDGEKEARLIALSCSEPPSGHCRWTLRLLAEKAVELEITDSVSHETVRQTLKKNELKPHLRKCWVIPPELNGQFVAQMEEVIDWYCQPYNPKMPVICMDEQSRQLIYRSKTSYFHSTWKT